MSNEVTTKKTRIPENPKKVPIKLVWAIYTGKKEKSHTTHTGKVIYEIILDPRYKEYNRATLTKPILQRYCEYANYLKENEKTKLITAHLN